MLGIGIFLSPPQVAGYIDSTFAFFAVWVAAGVIVLGGAMAFAELGRRMPEAGGDYVFQRAAFGPSVAFASGWGLFAAIFCGSIAAVAVALCQYQLSALLGVDLTQPLLGPITGAQLGGALIIVLLTALNAGGVRPAAMVQELTTFVPILLLIGLAVWAAFTGGHAQPEPVRESVTLSGVVKAYLAAYFAYSGWNAVIYVAGEVRDPERNIPRALIGGTLGITALYLALCVGFIAVLGLGGLAKAGEAGGAVAGVLGGGAAQTWTNLAVLLCLLATLNASILGGGRVAYAMACDGAFWRKAAHIDPETYAPTTALWLQAGWAVLLVLSNRFDQLLLAVSLTMVVTGGLTVAALFVLRRREGWKGPRVLPAVYLAASVVVVVVQLRDALTGDSPAPLLGLAVVAGAFLGHWIHGRRLRSEARSTPPQAAAE